MKVIFAEDDVVSRRVLETQLEHWGYEVISAADGSEAWEILQSDKRHSSSTLRTLIANDLEVKGFRMK